MLPADIKYPTDLDLLNQARQGTEKIRDCLYQEVKSKLKQKLLPNVRDHRASRCDDAKQKRSLWPAPVHRLVGLYVLSQSFKEFDQTFISRCTWIPACHHYNFPIVWKYNIGI